MLLLRLVAGGAMAYHGWKKLSGGVGHFVPVVQSRGFPLPELTAWVVTFLELVGGILIVVGLLTRLCSLLLAVEMLLTTVFVKFQAGLIAAKGSGYELDLLYLVAFLALLLLGPGRWSADWVLGLEPADARPAGRVDTRRF